MNNYAILAFDVLKAKILNKNIPLAVTWAVTYHCNRQCLHCYRWNGSSDELTTGQAKDILYKLKILGVRRINFTGGEPLLKEGIFELIDLAKQNNMIIVINTNGSLVPKNIHALEKTDLLNISIDGVGDDNDAIRGKGSYAEIIQAAKDAKQQNIRIRFSATLNKHSRENLLGMIQLAKDFETTVAFQVLESQRIGSDLPNPILLEETDLRQCIKKLAQFKKDSKYRKYIGNSASGLKYLAQWPNLKKMSCVFGQIAFRIEPNGHLRTCRKQSGCKPQDIDLNLGDINKLKAQIDALEVKNYNCACGCVGLVETNLVWNMNLLSALEVLEL